MSIEIGRAYDAVAIACGMGHADTGTEQCGITFELYDGDAVIGEVPYYGFLTDAAFEYTFKNLRTLGYTGTDPVNELDDLDRAGCAERLPNRVQIVAEENEWEGKTTVRVQYINAGGGVRLKNRLDAAGKAKLSDRIKARILLMEQQGGAKAPAQKRPKPSAVPRQATGTGGWDGTGPDPAGEDPPF